MTDRRLVPLCLILLLSACVGSGGAPGGGGVGDVATGGQAGESCDPGSQNLGCYGTFVMACGLDGQWAMDHACPMGTVCGEAGGSAQPTCLQMASPDAGASDDGGSTNAGESWTPQELACNRWSADRVDLSEGTWTGKVSGCQPGTLSDQAMDNAVRLVNLYRHFAGLPAVNHDPALSEKAQACALIMAANKALSHTPSKSWKCWSEGGSFAAKKSNISTAPAVRSVDRYMIDSGNNNAATLGHRRWILSRSLGPIGVGSTVSSASCLYVIGGKGKVNKAWTTWPPPGPIPVAAIRPYKGGNLDQTGWSVQSDTINLNFAKVKVSSDGATLPVKARVLKGGYGSKYAIAFVPQGWASAAGQTYTVEVSGISAPFKYAVEVVGCP